MVEPELGDVTAIVSGNSGSGWLALVSAYG
jgi:hypothetical protein